MKPGDRVRVKNFGHPHAHETGRIEGPATGGAASAGFEWEVKTDAGTAWGFFAMTSDLEVIPE